MDPDIQARMLYLILLGAFLLLVLFRSGLSLGRLLRTLILWGLIIAGLALAYTIVVEERPPSATISMSGADIVLTRAGDGHFHAELAVNGAPVRFIVDTGATDIVLSRDDAARVGVDTDLNFIGRAQTANGIVRTAPVRLDTITLGDRTDTNLRASVSEGTMPVSLLGMSYLDRFERIEIAGNEMRLVQ